MSTAVGSHPCSLRGHDPARYEPHALHGPGRSYPETNCYTDTLIELLHGSGYEPLAMLGHVVRVDFEGDQWTFFKPPPQDLERLFGIDIHEMQPYRPLPGQILGQLAEGRTIMVELDSFYLPDTAATDYRRAHVKTSIAAESIDVDAQVLRYYHGLSLHELQGEDYRGIFRLGEDCSPEILPPYTELVRFDAGPAVAGTELREVARQLLSWHLRRVAPGNPFQRFGEHLARELPALLDLDLASYHAYAVATVRMAGAAFELAAAHAQWLAGDVAAPVVHSLGEIVDGCKALGFRLARRRAFDPEPLVAHLAAEWERAIHALAEVAEVAE
jgi:hypothetical protein